MFLYNLTEEQKKAFLGVAHQFILADKKCSFEEGKMIEMMKIEMQLPPNMQPPQKNLEELLEQFGSRQSKISILLEIIGLGYADQDFNSDENDFIKKVSTIFGITEEERLSMENWVGRQLMLMQEAKAFFDENF